MSRTADQPARPGTKTTNPKDTVNTLKAYLSDENARVLLERLNTIEEDSENASDWPDVKARILRHKPQP